MKVAWWLALLMGLVVNTRAGETPPPLQKVEHFAFGGVGIAGTTSPGEIAFARVLNGKSARTDFVEATEKGTPAAKCYGLVGLRVTDPSAFEQAAQRLAARNDEVQTMAGCMMMKESIGAVIASIRKGNYDEAARQAKETSR
jgi:hypothetical protein